MTSLSTFKKKKGLIFNVDVLTAVPRTPSWEPLSADELVERVFLLTAVKGVIFCLWCRGHLEAEVDRIHLHRRLLFHPFSFRAVTRSRPLAPPVDRASLRASTRCWFQRKYWTTAARSKVKTIIDEFLGTGFCSPPCEYYCGSTVVVLL